MMESIIPNWQIAHHLSTIFSVLLGIFGVIGFILTSLALDFNAHNLVVLGWAACAVGLISTVVDGALLASLIRLDEPDQNRSFQKKYITKMRTIVFGIAANFGIAIALVAGIAVANSTAAGVKHSFIHPGVTKLMAILCVIAKAFTIIVDVRLMMKEVKDYKRFKSRVQEAQDEYHDEPLSPITGSTPDN